MQFLLARSLPLFLFFLFLLVPRLFFLVRISMKNRFDLVIKFEIKIFSRNREVEGKGEREREKGEIDLSIVPLQDSIINFIHLSLEYIYVRFGEINRRVKVGDRAEIIGSWAR